MREVQDESGTGARSGFDSFLFSFGRPWHAISRAVAAPVARSKRFRAYERQTRPLIDCKASS
jgi:hypothetical protein